MGYTQPLFVQGNSTYTHYTIPFLLVYTYRARGHPWIQQPMLIEKCTLPHTQIHSHPHILPNLHLTLGHILIILGLSRRQYIAIA
jgi:hypothetical protein